MIFQVRTTKDLGLSKRYFTKKEEVKKFIEDVVASTELFRKNDKTNSLPKLVTKFELNNSVEILAIDNEKIPEWRDLFGPGKEIDHLAIVEIKEKAHDSCKLHA